MIKTGSAKTHNGFNSSGEESMDEGSDPETRFSPSHGPIYMDGVPNDSGDLARNQVLM